MRRAQTGNPERSRHTSCTEEVARPCSTHGRQDRRDVRGRRSGRRARGERGGPAARRVDPAWRRRASRAGVLPVRVAGAGAVPGVRPSERGELRGGTVADGPADRAGARAGRSGAEAAAADRRGVRRRDAPLVEGARVVPGGDGGDRGRVARGGGGDHAGGARADGAQQAAGGGSAEGRGAAACVVRGPGRLDPVQWQGWVAKSENPRGTRGFGAGAAPERRKRGRLPRGMFTAGGHARSVAAGGRAGRTRWPSRAPRWAVRTT